MKHGGVGGFLKYWAQLLMLPIYWISHLTIRQKNKWVFGSTFGRRFADNPRYLYLYLNAHPEEGILPVWITRNRQVCTLLRSKGLRCYMQMSLPGIWHCLHAGVFIFDNYVKDINYWLSGRAVKVNLWHGVGNKRINYDNIHDQVRHPKNLWQRWCYFPRRLSDEKPYHYILSTSDTMVEIFARAFRVPMSHMILDGYPRNDTLLGENFPEIYTEDEADARKTILMAKADGLRIAQYYPTFRESEKRWPEVVDMDAFNEMLRERKIFFCMKPHPKSKLNEYLGKKQYSNIYPIPANVDVYAILQLADTMVTDYSSIYSDYILLHRPVVLFPYDEAEYQQNTREQYFTNEEYMCEECVHTMPELVEAMACEIADEESAERARRLLFATEEPACGSLTEQIRTIRNKRR